MTRAPDDILGQLHVRLAERMLAKLNSGEELTAAEMTAISMFLKNNGIEATTAQNPALDDLAGAILPEFDIDPQVWKVGH